MVITSITKLHVINMVRNCNFSLGDIESGEYAQLFSNQRIPNGIVAYIVNMLKYDAASKHLLHLLGVLGLTSLAIKEISEELRHNIEKLTYQYFIGFLQSFKYFQLKTESTIKKILYVVKN